VSGGTLAVLAAALAALAALGAWRWLRRRAGRRPRLPPPRLPVVLVHGLFGFDEVAIGKRRHAYFRDVGPRLEREGRQVRHARLPTVGSIPARARALADFVGGLGERRVILLAHSMGGLDARLAIARLGLAPRVAALVTVGTPHGGTPVADLTADVARKLGVTGFLAKAGVGLDALHGLTSQAMERFNEEVPDSGDVLQASVVGSVVRKRRTNPLLLASHLWLAERSGPNDGVVPASSQRWGLVLDEIEADHWAQIGWSRHFDAGGYYAELLRGVEKMVR